MPRFELGTSSLPRRHTAGLCHIGIFVEIESFLQSPLTRRAGSLIHRSELPNNVVSHPYKTLRKEKHESRKDSRNFMEHILAIYRSKRTNMLNALHYFIVC